MPDSCATSVRLLVSALLASVAVVGPAFKAPLRAGGWAACDGQQASCEVQAASESANPDDKALGWTTQVSEKVVDEPKPAPPAPPAKPISRAVLRRPPASSEQMAAGSSHADGACREDVPAFDVPFAVSVDGQAVDGTTGRNAADSQRCVDAALQRAEVQIKYDGLNTEPRLNVVAAPDAALKGDNVVFATHSNYDLQIARAEVRIFAKGTTVRQAPVAVVPVESRLALWSVPKDIREQIVHHRMSLKDSGPALESYERGPSATVEATPADGPRDAVIYVLRVYDGEGRFDETAPKVLDLANLRGGVTQANDLMAVYNGNALEVRNIPIVGGAVLVSGRNVPAGHTVSVLGVPAPVDEKGNFAIRQIVSPGPHAVTVQIANPKGVASVFERSVVIPDHDFFYVALADLTVGKNGTTGPASVLNPEKADEYQDKIYVNGRLAFYLKGKVSGDTLLTAAADTQEQPIKQLFSNLDSKDPRYLLRNLDPNKYYPVYGDDSTLSEDAPTRGKFYVRLERGDSNVVWGNFKTTITGTEFIRYDRGLYGARVQAKTGAATTAGERRGALEVFAAEPGTLGARDVFRGTGGSLYFISRQNVTQGSERISVEIRDRNTGLVVQTRTLVASQDYDINYLQGRVTLHSPLASTATDSLVVQSGGLGGSDQFLVVTYEFAPGLTAARDTVVGGRTSYWVGEHLQVGVTGYDQSTPGEKLQLLGSDVTLRLTPGTYVKIEGARSTGPGSGENVSVDGGFTFANKATTGRTAYAKRVEAAADLAEIIKGAQGRIQAFWKDKDRDYSGPGELAINRAATEMGARADVKLSERWSSKTKLDSKEDQYRNYSAAEQNLTYSFNDYWKATVGAKLDDNKVQTASASPTLNQNGRRLDTAVRAEFDPKLNWTAYGYVQGTLLRDGEREANNRIGFGGTLRLNEKWTALAELSEGSRGLGGKIGTEYKIDEKRSSYLNYALDPDRTDIISRGGAGILTAGSRERYTDSVSVFGEERLRHGGGYSGLTHAYGLDFVPYEHWKAGLGFETGNLTDPLSGDVQRTAVSASMGYKFSDIVYTAKFEYRNDEITTTASHTNRDTYLMNNAISVKVNPEWRAIGKFNGSYSSSNAGDFYQGNYLELVSGMAYRPIYNDRWNALFKYTYFYDVPSAGQIALPGGAGNFSQQTHVLSFDGAYDITPQITLGGKYAFRIGQLRDNSSGSPWFDNQVHLLIGRIDYHIVKEWEFMGEVRTLIDPEAKNQNTGALAAIYRNVNDNFKMGIGYNFTNYTDDLTNLSYNNKGIFVNAVGKF